MESSFPWGISNWVKTNFGVTWDAIHSLFIIIKYRHCYKNVNVESTMLLRNNVWCLFFRWKRSISKDVESNPLAFKSWREPTLFLWNGNNKKMFKFWSSQHFVCNNFHGGRWFYCNGIGQRVLPFDLGIEDSNLVGNRDLTFWL